MKKLVLLFALLACFGCQSMDRQPDSVTNNDQASVMNHMNCAEQPVYPNHWCRY